MASVKEPEVLTLFASNVSGQNTVKVAGVNPELSISELLNGLTTKMRLTTTDSEGRALTYQARLEREGRHLHASETVGEALQPGDRLTLQPNIMAG